MNITKKKSPLPSQYSMSFPGSHDEVVYIMMSINMNVGNDMYSGNYICDVLD